MGKPQDTIQARDTVTGTIPAACFDVCNNANLEAQSQGKVASLCDPNSPFRTYVDECNNCIDQRAGQSASSGRQYFDDALSPYFNFCAASSLTTTQSTASIPTSWLRYYGTFEPLTLSNLYTSGTSTASSTVLYKSINITSTIPAYFFHVAVQSLVSSYVPPAVFSELAASAAAAASAASITGDATSLVYAALEDTSRPPWFSSAIPSTYAAEFSTLDASVNELRVTPLSTANGSEATSTPGAASTSGATATQGATSTDSGSKAWIAGAVVGSIAGAVLILLGIVLFLRRKKLSAQVDKGSNEQGNDTYMTGFKPELHAESVQPPYRVYEMDASQNPSEMEVHEKPQELNAEQVKILARAPSQ